MENNSLNQGSETKKINKVPLNSFKKALLWLVIIVLLLLLSGFGIYKWQHDKLVAANKNISSQNSQLSQLDNKVKTLLMENNALNAEYKKSSSTLSSLQQGLGYSQTKFNITVDSSSYVDPYGHGSGIPPTAYVGVQITVHNPTNQSINLTTESFKLQDSQNNVYPVFNPSYVSNSGLPSGYVVLLDQVLSPNETVKGVVVFKLPNNSLHSFTFINGKNSYPIKVS